jgi:hypothetical protein
VRTCRRGGAGPGLKGGVQKGKGRAPVAPTEVLPQNVRCACGMQCINAGYNYYKHLLAKEEEAGKQQTVGKGGEAGGEAGQEVPKKPTQGYAVSLSSALAHHYKGFLKCGYWCCPWAPKAVADRWFDGKTCADIFCTYTSFKHKAGKGGPYRYQELVEAATAEGVLSNPQVNRLGSRLHGDIVRYGGQVGDLIYVRVVVL